MPELSTLLRQRLQATANPALPHPDADILTAYVEELLPAPERDEVVRHLSLCSQCREVVSLTLPEAVAASEPEAVAIAPSAPRRRWFLSPAFGMVGSIAAVVLGVALILRLPQNTKPIQGINTGQQVQEAKASAALAPAPANAPISQNRQGEDLPLLAQRQPAPAAPASQPSAESNTRIAKVIPVPAARSAARVGESKEGAPAAPVFTAQLRKQDYVNKMFLANSYSTQSAVPVYRDLPQAPTPVQSALVFAPPSVVAGNSFQSTGTFEVSSNAAGKNQGVVTFFSSESQENTTPGILGKIVDLGKRPLTRRLAAPIPSNSVGRSAMFKPGAPAAQTDDAIAAKTAERPDAGVLAQSQAFNSNALAALPRRQMLGVPQYQWKVVQGKLLRSSDLTHWTEENPAGEGVQFSVVSSNGPDIWAGGSQASLMHSTDGGTTWARVTLGASATGTINSIEVAGQNVHIKSSSGQAWSSQDGGKSWVLQD
jgi:Photosynthesis system II assembly factor YCF48